MGRISASDRDSGKNGLVNYYVTEGRQEFGEMLLFVEHFFFAIN